MGEVLPRHYIIGVIFFGFFIVSGVFLISGMFAKDPTMGGQQEFIDFNKTFNKMSEVQENVEDIQSNIENAGTDFGTFGVLNALINGAWQNLKLLFASFGFMTAAYEGLTAFFGIPAYIPLTMGLVVIVVIGFGIWSAIFQREL